MSTKSERKTEALALAGARCASFARSTGSLILLADAAAQGYDPDSGGRWVTVCLDHDADVQHDNLKNGYGWMSAPETWCPDCAGQIAQAAQ